MLRSPWADPPVQKHTGHGPLLGPQNVESGGRGALKPASDLTFPFTDDASESQEGDHSLTVTLKYRAKTRQGLWFCVSSPRSFPSSSNSPSETWPTCLSSVNSCSTFRNTHAAVTVFHAASLLLCALSLRLGKDCGFVCPPYLQLCAE